MPDHKITALKTGNILLFIAMVIVNYLSTSLPINGVSVIEVTYTYTNALIPAGFTFSIWGIIYLLLLLFSVYQLVDKTNQVTQKAGLLFMGTSFLNICWIYSWHHYHIGLCLVIITTYLIMLFVLYQRMAPLMNGSAKEIWLVCIPFSVYMGWLTIATLENLSTWLVSINKIDMGLPTIVWAIINISISLLAALFFRLRFNDRAYCLVIAWALFGIASRQYDANGINNIAIGMITGSGLAVLLALLPNRTRHINA